MWCIIQQTYIHFISRNAIIHILIYVVQPDHIHVLCCNLLHCHTITLNGGPLSRSVLVPARRPPTSSSK